MPIQSLALLNGVEYCYKGRGLFSGEHECMSTGNVIHIFFVYIWIFKALSATGKVPGKIQLLVFKMSRTKVKSVLLV